ncbi:IPP protein, partial [Polyodon spathula]|nr:IPP protein [Polyodon spathula]
MACVDQSKVDGATATPHQTHYSSDKYARRILAQMNRMRILKDFCDVQLLVGGRQFSVHRLVLAASSPYFTALFTGGMREADKDIVQILGVEADVFEMLLEFIYSGVINVTVDNVQELIITADMLQLSEVVKICCEFLKVQMDPSNCVGIYQFLEQIACLDMMAFTENYIHVHFLEVCAGEEFPGLAKAQLVKFLRSEELRIEDEYQVFIAAMNWVLKDVARRKKHVVEVLDPIRFPLLSPQRLFKYIEERWRCHTQSTAPQLSQTVSVCTNNNKRISGLRVALQTLLKEYTEVSKSPKENKMFSVLQPAKIRPRRKARKYLYAIGGYTRLQGGRWSDSRALSCVERFDSFSQYWTTVSSLHQARSGLGVAVLEGMIYVIGGEKDSMIFDCAERYDPVTKQWAAVASLNFPRCGVAVCSCHGALYALGGWIGSEIGKTMERYDPTDNKWEIVGSMAVPRYYFGCCELQGKELSVNVTVGIIIY